MFQIAMGFGTIRITSFIVGFIIVTGTGRWRGAW
jgi:hypothetical protein